MNRSTKLLGLCLTVGIACSGPGGPSVDDRALHNDFVGGWDAETKEGTGVLLIREGLVGTLNGAVLEGSDRQYQIIYEVEGEVDEQALNLGLSCAEARERGFSTVDGATEPSSSPSSADESPWSSVDCAGWDLQLSCSLAGDCATGDCNMVCDVMFFGDAYARSEIGLASVEDEFDYWQRA